MWETPPQNLSLKNSEIHIWLINIDDFTQHLQFFSNFLSPEELLRASKYRGDNLQNNFIINRGLLRAILAKYLPTNPHEIEFNYQSKGKPFIINSNPNQIKFNLSHKNKYTIYSICNNDLGIDIEAIRSNINVEDIAKRFFTAHEYNKLCRFSAAKQLEYFFQLWTAKEAYLKAIGEGLSGGLNSINLSKKDNDKTWRIEINNLSPEENKMWQIITFNVVPNYLASLAIKMENDFKIKYYLVDSLF